MKAAKWRDLSDDELRQRMRELSEEIFNLRFQLSMGVAKNPARLGEAKKDVARAHTILRERHGASASGVPASAGSAAPPDTGKNAVGRKKAR